MGVCLVHTIKTLVHTNGFSSKQILACAHDFNNFFPLSYEHQKRLMHTQLKNENIMFFAHTAKK